VWEFKNFFHRAARQFKKICFKFFPPQVNSRQKNNTPKKPIPQKNYYPKTNQRRKNITPNYPTPQKIIAPNKPTR